jgi:prepilin-type N-terminal cleavage/methylation domain-containing protein
MKGFTLIEVIVYIALLGALMTGALTSAVNLIQSTGSSNGKATVQEEGSFVVRKLEWALSGMTSVPTVTNSGTCSGGGNAQSLTVNKTNAPQNPIVFSYNSASTSVDVKEGILAKEHLTTENVSVSCLKFAVLTINGTPAGIIATTTINGLDFSVTKYVRQ